ncbi:hypothetical protein K3495_g8114 [Podosphaera aphanis]|nr:hypothetical protein K3495_g8114 [Podosphaera aphanis]
MAGSTLKALKPMNTQEIAAKAQEFEFNPFIPLKFWIRTSDTLLREALIYEQEDNDQQVYLLLLRYAALVTEKLPLHPSAKNPEFKQALRSIQRTLPRILDTLENLKPRINYRHSAWERALESRAEVSNPHDKTRLATPCELTSSDPAIAGKDTILGTAENSELAVRLAHHEIRRRDELRRSARDTNISEQNQERRIDGLRDNWEIASSKEKYSDEEDTRKQLQEPRRLIDNSHDGALMEGKLRPFRPPSSNDYRYPAVAKPQPLQYQDGFQRDLIYKSPPPMIPPKYLNQDVVNSQKIPPPLPQKSPIESSLPHVSHHSPPNFTFRPSSYLENGNPLRTVFLPPGLRLEFLRQVEHNTCRNLETCGMLCGTLISNALFIRRVVIPEQKSTSDTCETTDEGALFDYCDKEDLLVLGWIHTHPTQTCFMSSRDLHTHSGYQIMMPESIAIVCAPSKNPSWGVFRLTDPPGLSAILNCTQTGLFHPHIETNIYTDALRPGHVAEATGMEFEVIDLRSH